MPQILVALGFSEPVKYEVAKFRMIAGFWWMQVTKRNCKLDPSPTRVTLGDRRKS